MKIVLKILLIALAIGYLAFAVSTLRHPAEERVCETLVIEVEDNPIHNFVDSSYIHSLLKKQKIALQGEKLSQINLQEIEDLLKENPYIDSVDCYHTDRGALCISVFPQKPILMVMAGNGEKYYVDRRGNTMPLDKFNLSLCVATGNISKDFAAKQLLPLAEYIHQHSFWNKQIEQIHVVSEDEITLHPRVGEHTIILGEIRNFEDKLNRMLLFYEKGLPQVGWNQYESINLAYKGQIVCKRHNKK